MDAFAATLAAQIDALWDFGAVADTQRHFEALLDEALALCPALPTAHSDGTTPDHAAAVGRAFPPVLELLTQIARTQGLQREFESAHATLDRVQRALWYPEPTDRTALGETATRAHVRYLLERGRVFNSSKQQDLARPLFVHAWRLARQCAPTPEEALAVDAAHMVAIAEPTTEKQTEWNLRAIATAEAARDPAARKWLGSLANNLGWTYHDTGRFDQALEMFEKALEYRERAGEAKTISIAKWCKARCLRSLGRVDEALAIQQALWVENQKLAAPDGYNSEELGELFLLKGDREQARIHFTRAVEQLSGDAWFVENEQDRLQRLRTLAAGTTNKPMK